MKRDFTGYSTKPAFSVRDDLSGLKKLVIEHLRNLQNYTSDRLSLIHLFPIFLISLVYLSFGLKASIVCSLILMDFLVVKLFSTFGIPLGLEFGSLATVLAGLWLGPFTGAFIGLVVMMLRSGAGVVGFFISWKIPGFIALGFLSGYLSIDLFIGGFYLLLVMRGSFAIITFLASKELLGMTIPYQITNIYINYYIFKAVSSHV